SLGKPPADRNRRPLPTAAAAVEGRRGRLEASSIRGAPVSLRGPRATAIRWQARRPSPPPRHDSVPPLETAARATVVHKAQRSGASPFPPHARHARDGCLQRIWPRASASQACLDQSEPFANPLLIPQTPVLLPKKNRFALGL